MHIVLFTHWLINKHIIWHCFLFVCLFWIWLVWCVWQSIWAFSGPSRYTTSFTPSFGCSGVHISECESGTSPKAAHGAHEVGPGRAHATICLLWQNSDLDYIRVMGICGSNISRHFLRPWDGDAGEDLLKLVQASWLHCLSIQHTPSQ